MFNQFATKLRPYIPLMLRLGLGFVFLWSGLSKIISPDNAIGVCTNRAEAIDLVSTFGWLPFDPEIFVWVQSALEFILGVALIAGFLVPAAALVSVTVFLVFFGLLDFALVWKNVGMLAVAAALYSAGSGPWSVDEWLKRRVPVA
jgi:uncharacterized membrane protein YphA (DoxX/SURF4 family)